MSWPKGEYAVQVFDLAGIDLHVAARDDVVGGLLKRRTTNIAFNLYARNIVCLFSLDNNPRITDNGAVALGEALEKNNCLIELG